ncbi:MAG: DUF6252 family protein [Alkalispirochaeta sp.]
MKSTRTVTIFPVAIVLALFLVGCDNPTSGDDDDPDTDETYTATIDGEAWSAPEASVVFSQGNLRIEGNTPEEEFDIWITVPEDIAVGTYDLGSGSDDPPTAVLVTEGSSSGTHYPDPAGELVIESHDTDNDNIKGTFEFVAKKTDGTDEHSVTDGTINFDGEFYSE